MTSAPLPLIKSEDFAQTVDEAYGFYLTNAGLLIAEKFLIVVETATRKIAENPFVGTRYHSPESFAAMKSLHYRQLNLANSSAFPYTIYYEIEADRILVHVMFHHSRHRDRLLHS